MQYHIEVLYKIECKIMYNYTFLIIDSNYKPVKVEIKKIPKGESCKIIM